MRPAEACARAWSLRRPGVDIVWERRSLTDFGDQPLEAVAADYDLLVIDHPFCGTALELGCLRPLDALLDAVTLDALAGDAVGPSHESYRYAGHQWALAFDAACQLSALRLDLLGEHPPPATWDQVLALAHELPGRVALPLSPPHAICSFLTICANAGMPACVQTDRFADPDTAQAAVELLTTLARLGPAEALDWEPPDALHALTSTDDLVHVPLTFGFVTYSTPGSVARPCRFAGVPSAGRGSVGSILGGAGLAVSAASTQPEEAAAFAAWMTGADIQRDLVARAGGQPGSRSAWDDPELDRAHGGFFSASRATIDAAWIRPRARWWPEFQLEAGRILNRGLRSARSASEIVGELEARHNDARRRHHEGR